jgi:hypothetical protein
VATVDENCGDNWACNDDDAETDDRRSRDAPKTGGEEGRLGAAGHSSRYIQLAIVVTP